MRLGSGDVLRYRCSILETFRTFQACYLLNPLNSMLCHIAPVEPGQCKCWNAKILLKPPGQPIHHRQAPPTTTFPGQNTNSQIAYGFKIHTMKCQKQSLRSLSIFLYQALKTILSSRSALSAPSLVPLVHTNSVGNMSCVDSRREVTIDMKRKNRRVLVNE